MSKYGPKITVKGYLALDPHESYNTNGKRLITLRLNDTPIADRTRPYNDPERYVGEQQWYTIDAWTEHADKIAEMKLTKGTWVEITGRLVIRKNKNDQPHLIIRYPEITLNQPAEEQ